MVERWQTGERDYVVLELEAKARLAAARFRPDYFGFRRANDSQLPAREDTELRVFAAAWLGRARLIDNVPVGLAQ